MAEDTVKLLTTFDKEQEVVLPRCKAMVKLEVPGAAGMVAATDFAKKNSSKDLIICRYIFKNHVIEPSTAGMTDQEIDDMVAKMHYEDVATVILAFFNVDLQKMDPDQVKALFHQTGLDEPSLR